MSGNYVLEPQDTVNIWTGQIVSRFAIRLWRSQDASWWRSEVIDRTADTLTMCDHRHRFDHAALECGRKRIRVASAAARRGDIVTRVHTQKESDRE